MRIVAAIVALVLVSLGQGASADVYKCELPGGKVAYQPAPCTTGKASTIKTPAPAGQVPPSQENSGVATASGSPGSGHREGPRQQGSLQKDMTLLAPRGNLRFAFESIAFASDHTLVMDPSINDAGDFAYENIPGNVLLAELANRYNLVVQVENRVIRVTRR